MVEADRIFFDEEDAMEVMFFDEKTKFLSSKLRYLNVVYGCNISLYKKRYLIIRTGDSFIWSSVFSDGGFPAFIMSDTLKHIYFPEQPTDRHNDFHNSIRIKVKDKIRTDNDIHYYFNKINRRLFTLTEFEKIVNNRNILHLVYGNGLFEWDNEEHHVMIAPNHELKIKGDVKKIGVYFDRTVNDYTQLFTRTKRMGLTHSLKMLESLVFFCDNTIKHKLLDILIGMDMKKIMFINNERIV